MIGALAYEDLVKEMARQFKLIHEHLDRLEKKMCDFDRRLAAATSGALVTADSTTKAVAEGNQGATKPKGIWESPPKKETER